jgi:Ras-related protein Rab-2A
VTHHDVTIGVEFGSRIVPVGPPHSKPPRTIAPAPVSPSSPSAEGAESHKKPPPSSSSPPTPATSGLPEPPRQPSATGPQQHMKLSLWDTAGQETYKSVTRSYFRGASGALLVFDLSRRQTFQHVTDWLNDLRQIAEPDIVVILVGNKADLAQPSAGGAEDGPASAAGGAGAAGAAASESGGRREGGGSGSGGGNKREVTRAEAEEWARKNGVLEYVETSAKSGENVEEAFMRVAERIFQNIQAGKYDLNDRRSGVKGPSAGSAGSRSAQVRLTDGSKSAASGCCY